MDLIKPNPLKPGDTLGIFTPSWPGHCTQREKFDYALNQVKELGYKTKLGSVTNSFSREGYRAASGRERAAELMELIHDPGVHAVMATLGGSVSNSMLEFLDYDFIRNARKPIIGHSDLTSLLLGIHKKAGIVTFYGPMLVPSLGEYPKPLDLTLSSFFAAISSSGDGKRVLEVPNLWSNQSREVSTGQWNQGERQYQENTGWSVLNTGEADGLSLAANLNTLCSNLGTDYVPSFKGRILFIEQLVMDLEKEERQLSQLRLAGVFDEISGLVVSKPEVLETGDAPFSPEDLYREIIGPRSYPIVWNFDCGHTHPSHTIPIGVRVSIRATDLVEIGIFDS